MLVFDWSWRPKRIGSIDDTVYDRFKAEGAEGRVHRRMGTRGLSSMNFTRRTEEEKIGILEQSTIIIYCISAMCSDVLFSSTTTKVETMAIKQCIRVYAKKEALLMEPEQTPNFAA
jgi:hypothetical protein